jgi:hypothetical protein
MSMPVFPLDRGAHEGALSLHRAPMSALDTAPEGGFRSIGPQGSGAGKARGAWFAALLLVVFAALAGCDSTPPEEKLKATIAKMEVDGEAHKVSDVMDAVAADFGGEGMDRKGLQRFLTLVSMQNANVGVTIGPVEVEVIGERATAKFTLAATGGAGRFLPDRAQVYDVTTGWRLEGGEWKLISAQWKDQL